jgi:nucleoside-diphosphate-sugar epimerase
VGAAAALRLAADGWEVTSSGRSAGRFPQELREAGVRFARSDRHAAGDLRELLHPGADAVIDCAGYTAAHARLLLPFRQGIGSLVFISSKAVYVDGRGHHSNSDEPPDFGGPVTEEQPTMVPSDIDYNSREGYGASKVAAEKGPPRLRDGGQRPAPLPRPRCRRRPAAGRDRRRMPT